MNIKPNSKKERLNVCYGLFLCVLLYTVFLSVVFRALSLVPESASIVPAGLLRALTTPGDLSGVIQIILSFCRSWTSSLFLLLLCFWCAAAVQKPLLASQPRFSDVVTVFLCHSHRRLAAARWDCAPEICISSSSVLNVRNNYLPSLYHTLDPVLQQQQGCCHRFLFCWHKLSSGCVSVQGFCGVARLPQHRCLDLWITGLWPCSCALQKCTYATKYIRMNIHHLQPIQNSKTQR